jgi:hypothetical protein
MVRRIQTAAGRRASRGVDRKAGATGGCCPEYPVASAILCSPAVSALPATRGVVSS